MPPFQLGENSEILRPSNANCGGALNLAPIARDKTARIGARTDAHRPRIRGATADRSWMQWCLRPGCSSDFKWSYSVCRGRPYLSMPYADAVSWVALSIAAKSTGSAGQCITGLRNILRRRVRGMSFADVMTAIGRAEETMNAKLVNVLWIGVCFAGCILANARVTAEPPTDAWQEVTKGDLVLEIPSDWKPFGSSAPDEGRWRTGFGAASGTVRVMRDRPFERLKTGMVVDSKESVTLAGRAATAHKGHVGEGASQRKAMAIVQDSPDANGALLAIVCEAPEDHWSDFESAFFQVVYTARPVGARRPEFPPPMAESAARWYVHGRGGFRISLPEGWRVEPAHAQTVQDEDFDTVYDDTGKITVVLARVRERVTDVDNALARWRKERLSSLKQRVGEERLQLAGYPAMRLSYIEAGGTVAVSRFSLVAFGYRYPLTVYAPPIDETDVVPLKVMKWLEGMQFLHSPSAIQSLQTVNAGAASLRIPGNWKPLDISDDDAVVGRWGVSDKLHGSFTVTLERSSNSTELRDRIAILQRYFPVQLKTMKGHAYCGIVYRPVGQGMTVIFDSIDDQERYWALSFRADGDAWSRYEWEAMQVVESLTLTNITAGAAVKPPGLGKVITGYERIPSLRGEHAYRVTCFADGIELHNLTTGRSEMARIAFASLPAHAQLQPILAKDSQLAKRLGPANSDRISMFDDAVRVQLFEGGMMLTETSTRYTWWLYHPLRTAP